MDYRLCVPKAASSGDRPAMPLSVNKKRKQPNQDFSKILETEIAKQKRNSEMEL